MEDKIQIKKIIYQGFGPEGMFWHEHDFENSEIVVSIERGRFSKKNLLEKIFLKFKNSGIENDIFKACQLPLSFDEVKKDDIMMPRDEYMKFILNFIQLTATTENPFEFRHFFIIAYE